MTEAIILALLSSIFGASFLKKKLYCLFVHYPGSPTAWLLMNPKGNSALRCRKALKELMVLDIRPDSWLILPLGMNPPAPKG